MNIVDLAILKKMVAGGGGSGTDNYNDLSNLPQINGETLAGNKTAANLGLQDALTFDSAPTEDSTNPVESGGVYNALAGKQDNLTFDGVYNASTNKAATESTVTNAIAGLDVSAFSVDADETISSISETDGKISATKQDIAIASNQVVAMTGYTKPSSAPATPAIQQGDTANTAFGKLEFKADTNQTNILYALQTGVKNVLPFTATSMTDDNVTFTRNSDGSITVNSNGAISANKNLAFFEGKMSELVKESGDYVLYGNSSNSRVKMWFYYTDNWSGVFDPDTSETDTYIIHNITKSDRPVIVRVKVESGTALSNVTIYPMICTKAAWDQEPNVYRPFARQNSDLTQGLAELNAHPFLTVPFNHNMVYRGKNLGDTLTDAQHTALSGGNFTDLYLGDYWTKTVTIPAGTYTGGDSTEVTVPAQTNITLKAVIADFDTFYAGYASTYAGINTHHAAVIVTGFSNVVWNGTNSTAGGYVNSLIHKWLVGSALPQIETWFGSAKVLSHQKLLTNAITGDAASGWAWSSQKISLLSENQMYGSKVWGNSKASNGGYEPGEAFKHLNVFNHIDANLLFGNKNIWLRDIASAEWSAGLSRSGYASDSDASATWVAPAALILLS